MEVPLSVDPDSILERYVTMARRTQPLRLEFPWREVNDELVQLPRGATIRSMPPDVRIDGPYGSYELTVRAQGRGYRVSEKSEVRATRVAPSKYVAFREFLSKVAQARGARVVVELDRP